MANTDNDSQSGVFQAIMNLPSLMRALYYSDDFQTRVCWWFVYTLVILVVLIHVSWRLYGTEISKTFMQQGGQYTPTRHRSQDGIPPGQHVKVD